MQTPFYLLRFIVAACLLFPFGTLHSQTRKDQVYVDRGGVMRWSQGHSELYGFGVNYTLPFAHEYRMALRSGTSPEDAIRQDVYHMARLDLDFYRVHVFDTEVSDTLGNLIDNEHLKLFDFLINEMEARGMHFIITPIAYWGNGWPENDGKTPGFSAKYGKAACLTNPDAIKAQANYLEQFMRHVNFYNGKAYKDDADIIGFEVCNEPHHSGTPESVTGFINIMVSSIRKSGCTKPVFYNMSHSIHLAQAYLDAGIQGGTFQWYPTNLVANHQIHGNFMPQVASYPIPFAGNPGFRKMAKIIYEFDAADADGNYMYPAMATTFRKTGMQLAAQFAYDAMCWAPWNTNYGTHFMNLAYAPQKAISLKIASAVFHHQPLYEDADSSLRISYTADLAEWITTEKFFYSNNTSYVHSNTESLREIAGWGSSTLVAYSGTGAYFLDKLDDGIWRLEVMPDAYWINDPYSPATPRIQKAGVIHALQEMTIDLPDLGKDFSIEPVNKGNSFISPVTRGKFSVMPGVYLLKRKNTPNISKDGPYKNIRINEYVAPATNLTGNYVWNHIPGEASADKPLIMKFEAVSSFPIKKAEVIISNARQRTTLTAISDGNSRFHVPLSGELTTSGFMDYQILLENQKDTTIFPGVIKGSPYRWDNRNSGEYRIRFVPERSPLILWDPETDWDYTYKTWNRHVTIIPTDFGSTALNIHFSEFPHENPADSNERSYSYKYYFGDKIKGRTAELPLKKFLAIRAVNNGKSVQPVELGLIDQNGSVATVTVAINPGDTVCRLPVESFTVGSYLILPRPYPDFLPFRTLSTTKSFDRSMLEMLQVCIRPGKEAGANMLIEKIWLE